MPNPEISQQAREMLAVAASGCYALSIRKAPHLDRSTTVMVAAALRAIEAALALTRQPDGYMRGEADGPAFFEKVAETVQEADGAGFWRACSGCHETEDGHDVGHYPHSPSFNCQLGGGCNECGGIGAIWDTTDYGAMAAEMLGDDMSAIRKLGGAE